MRQKWEEWMLAVGMERVRANGLTPSREDIANWSICAMETFPSQIVKNAWRHGDYSWFPGELQNNTTNE